MKPLPKSDEKRNGNYAGLQKLIERLKNKNKRLIDATKKITKRASMNASIRRETEDALRSIEESERSMQYFLRLYSIKQLHRYQSGTQISIEHLLHLKPVQEKNNSNNPGSSKLSEEQTS